MLKCTAAQSAVKREPSWNGRTICERARAGCWVIAAMHASSVQAAVFPDKNNVSWLPLLEGTHSRGCALSSRSFINVCFCFLGSYGAPFPRYYTEPDYRTTQQTLHDWLARNRLIVPICGGWSGLGRPSLQTTLTACISRQCNRWIKFTRMSIQFLLSELFLGPCRR